MSRPSFFQWMLLAVTCGASASFSWVIGRGLAIGPAPIRGGVVKSSETLAISLPSRLIETRPSPAWKVTGPDSRVLVAPVAGSTVRTALWSSTMAVAKSAEGRQISEERLPL